MVNITYRPSDLEILSKILNENGTYMLVVHNRHVVKCEKTVPMKSATKRNPKTDQEE